MCNNSVIMTREDKKAFDDKDTYRKVYRMQATGAGGKTIRTSVPCEVVEKEARRCNMTIDEFVAKFRVEWLYNGFEGAWARFVPKE